MVMFTGGDAIPPDGTSVQWNIDELGVSQSEGAAPDFTVRHIKFVLPEDLDISGSP